jgi:hypothetical protein
VIPPAAILALASFFLGYYINVGAVSTANLRAEQEVRRVVAEVNAELAQFRESAIEGKTRATILLEDVSDLERRATKASVAVAALEGMQSAGDIVAGVYAKLKNDVGVESLFFGSKMSGLIDTGSFSMKAVDTRELTDNSSCPSGPPGRRGQLDGRVRFNHEFPDPPRVVAALSGLDAIGHNGDDSIRISLEVVSVDRTGFNFRFYTWCRTRIFSAVATWIALP